MKQVIILMLSGLSACQTGVSAVLGIGEGIRHDDFVYSVRRVTIMESSSRLNRANPGNRLWLVMFQVENQAKRVAHSWTDSTAYVSDSAGNHYESMTYSSARLKRTPAGHTDSTALLFSLPKTLKQPYLQVRGETLMGDVLDGERFKKTKIRLF